MEKKKITCIIPCYNEEESLNLCYQALVAEASKLPRYEFTFLFINDGSSDGTLAGIKRLTSKDERVQYVSLSRNFGKEPAMLAGFDYADGDAAIVLDADLQDPPSLFPQLIAEWEKGYEDVYAQRRSRAGETWLKRTTSKLYYRIIARLSDVPVQVDTGDFRLRDRKCILALRRLREHQRYTKGLFSWLGFKKKAVLYDRAPRVAGETHWNYWKLMKLAINGITSFSTIPLQVSSWLGALISCGAFCYMAFIIGKTLLLGDDVPGYPSLIAVLLFVSGIQLMILGILGGYLGRVFIEAKGRPVYLVGEVKAGRDGWNGNRSNGV